MYGWFHHLPINPIALLLDIDCSMLRVEIKLIYQHFSFLFRISISHLSILYLFTPV